jgi:hypothetical protein
MLLKVFDQPIFIQLIKDCIDHQQCSQLNITYYRIKIPLLCSEIFIFLIDIISIESNINHPHLNVMNIFQSIDSIGRGSVLLALMLTTTAPAQAISNVPGQQPKIALTRSYSCSPVKGKWSYLGKPGPVISLYGVDSISVDMSAYGGPRARGRILHPLPGVLPNQIEVDFAGETLIGTLDGMGRISWNNGTIWQAEDIDGVWRDNTTSLGPKIKQSREYLNTGGEVKYTGTDLLDIDMSRYGRPNAKGSMQTNRSSLSVTFADRSSTPQTGTAVSPTCIKWSDGTFWVR